MKTINKKNIVLNSMGNQWIFFIKPDGYIHYVVRKGRDDYFNDRLETDRPVTGFHVDVDQADNIHIIAILTDNTVVYLKYDNDGWNRHMLYKFSETSSHVRCPMIISGTDGLHLFYILSDNAGNAAIFHHVWEKKKWKGYKVFDVRNGEDILGYDIYFNHQGELYLASGTSQAIRIWLFTKDRWINRIESSAQVFSNTSGIILQEGCLCVKSSEGVFYAADINMLGKELPMEIIRSRKIEEDPVMISRKKNMSIAWVEEGKLWYRTSYDGGYSWSRVKLYNMQHGPLERYYMVNNLTSIFNAKYVIATSPPDIHIPLVHKAMERIRFPEECFAADAVNRGERLQRGSVIQKDGGLMAEDLSKDIGGILYENDRKGLTLEGDKASDNFEYKMPDRQMASEAIKLSDETEKRLNGMWQDIKQELGRIKSDMVELKSRLDTDIIRRIDSLEAQMENINKKKEKSAEGGRTMTETMGSIISQEMISRYLKKKR
jgi:hypothetical protein